MSDTQVNGATVESAAREMGWRPKEEFRGEPDNWVDAGEFVRRGETVMPLLKAANGKLKAELDTVRGTVTELQATVAAAQESLAEFREYHDQTAKTAYDRALRDLRRQREEARKEGDVDEVVEIETAIDKLQEGAAKPLPSGKGVDAPSPTPAATPTLHPDLAAWETDNAGWLADPTKKAYAQSVATYVRATNPKVVGRAFLDKITEQVEKEFGTARRGGDPVEGGNPPPPSGGRSRSFSALPADAKAACDRMGNRLVGQGRAFKTLDDWRTQYVKDYDWS